MKTSTGRKPRRAALAAWLGGRVAVAAAVAVGLVAASATPAFAAYSHTQIANKFSLSAPCTRIISIAVAESEGYVYVSCEGGSYPNEVTEVQRFTLSGEAAAFEASAPYISGNVITGDPGSQDGTLTSNPQVAVDNSSSPNHGRLFVTSSPNVDIFAPSGLHVGAVHQPLETSIPNRLSGVDVGPDGSIYVTSWLPGGRISKYTPALQEVKRLYTAIETFGGTVDDISVDSTGAVWTRKGGKVTKYEEDQFTEELKPAFGFPKERLIPFLAKPSPYAANPLVSGAGRLDVDTSNNDVYIPVGGEVRVYSEGTPEEASHQDAPPIGQGVLSSSQAVAVTANHYVYAATNGALGPEIIRFGPGDILPNIRTSEVNITEVGHTEATVHGRIELAGGANITGCKVEYGTTTSYSSGSKSCSPDPATSNFTSDTNVEAELTGLTTGTTYHFRIAAENEHGVNYGIDRTVVPAYVLQLLTLPATNIDTEGGTLNASFDPDGESTTYHFQYGTSTNYGLETEPEAGGSGSSTTDVSTRLTGLPTGKTFHYRVVATNSQGTTIGPDQSFRTASVPDISGVGATNVTAESAVLHATVSPVGYATKYRFEYGATPEYGNAAPAVMTSLESTTEPVEVTQKIEGLHSGVTYHFRIVAENEWGPNSSPDTTFDYAPPACPNDHVRQQTFSSYLPDCRAYELVSPGVAGAAVLFPSDAIGDLTANSQFGEYLTYLNNRGFASSPSRFTFYGGLSTIQGLNSPIGPRDMYMATRTVTGWKTQVPGLQGQQAFQTGRKECSETLELCSDHAETEGEGFTAESAPYVYNYNGQYKGRLPTNVNVIPGGKQFHGIQVMSGDFSHFVFSSSEFKSFSDAYPGIAFAPGAVTTGLGSAYDNDIGARTVKIISVLNDGSPIPLQGPKTSKEVGFNFPGVSADGSHILMQTPAAGGLVYLYMRVDDAHTFEIGAGEPVKPIGMTRDGKKVFFTTTAQLAPEDTDNSSDLYMWQEEGPHGPDEVTLLSQGAGNGNSDACTVSWVSGCGVQPLTPERAHPNENKMISAPGQDDLFAESSGDVYFYSPENLDPSRHGIKDERNLYVYREGAPHLVATFEPGTEVNRMQISPDGAHAAFLTAARLTGYNNNGYREVYTFDPTSGAIRCASCSPSGAPPTADAAVSQSGRFMSDDGRTFFSTADSLVPRDQNGGIIDVYEYVGGHPQLITSGLGSKDYTGGSEVLGLAFKPEYTGLEAVSRNGIDVYFSTFETLVDEDLNGEYVKFYDARTNGGFPVNTEPAPCAAADECHGAGSLPPAAPVISSDGNLNGGNVPPESGAKNTHKARRGQKKGRRHRHARKHGKARRHKRKHKQRHRRTTRRHGARHRNG